MKSLLAAVLISLTTASSAFAADIPVADRTKIIDAITAIAAGADRHQWDRVRAAFTEEVTTDYTSLFGGEVVTQLAKTLVGQWSGFLPGFEATQHLVTNHTIASATSETATVQADFQATHRIGKDLWTLGGRYDYQLVKIGFEWKVSSLTMIALWEMGSRDLIQRAAARMKAKSGK